MSYERLREKFAAKLSVMESLTMTPDIWTSQAMKSFLGVTAHFPEKKKIISVELCAKPLKKRCSSGNLIKALQDMLSEWGINVQAVIGVVTDGGANIVGAVKVVFGEKKHIGCFTHLLNGVGQAAIGLTTHKICLDTNWSCPCKHGARQDLSALFDLSRRVLCAVLNTIEEDVRQMELLVEVP
ncbi:hypothetical protein FOCC_FOCC016873, partial [Frankliniella occidentalis]